jgi:hypothetical protein
MPGTHASAQHSSFSFLKALNGEPLKNEYDASKPNDYEELMRERERRKREAEEEAERAARLREAEQVRLLLSCVSCSQWKLLTTQHQCPAADWCRVCTSSSCVPLSSSQPGYASTAVTLLHNLRSTWSAGTFSDKAAA